MLNDILDMCACGVGTNGQTLVEGLGGGGSMGRVVVLHVTDLTLNLLYKNYLFSVFFK
jgi:hypothetical protein